MTLVFLFLSMLASGFEGDRPERGRRSQERPRQSDGVVWSADSNLPPPPLR
jgi:hypothetical protein